jgi:hydroxymethylbilane synthase
MPVSSAARTLTIGSRGSQLALWQARYVGSRLDALGVSTRLQIITTTGDHLQTASLVQAGGKGLFTKEIEEALLVGTIDLAVHSLKDLPTQMPAGLAIAAIPEREDPRDAILGSRLADLPHGARVGTSSLRRAAQLRALRPDLNLEPIRGNVDTRIRKLREGQFDAILLALAGLRRLGLEREAVEIFSPLEICPAPGQGALAIQTREKNPAFDICSELNHQPSSQGVRCERAVLAALGGGCQLPVGAFAEIRGESLEAMAVVISPDGSRLVKGSRTGSRSRPEELGGALAEDLLSRGARRILAETG